MGERRAAYSYRSLLLLDWQSILSEASQQVWRSSMWLSTARKSWPTTLRGREKRYGVGDSEPSL